MVKWRAGAAVAVIVFLAGCSSSKHSAVPTSTAPTSPTTLIGGSASTTKAPTTASTAAPTTTTTTPTLHLGSLVGEWGSHRAFVKLRADGTGTGAWRIYQWCSDDPTPPCDAMINSNIIDGGNADFRVTAVHGNQAFATVLHSTDPKTLPKGDIIITLVAGDELQVGALGPLCGPKAARDACGA